MNKKIKIIIAIIAAIFLIAAIVMLFLKKPADTPATGNENNTEAVNTLEPVKIKDNSIVAKTWYSDREDNDILTLNEDGSYKGSKFLNTGMFSIDNGIITCSSMLDGIVELQIIKKDDTLCLLFENDKLSFYYYDTQEAATAAKEAKASMIQEEKEAANENLPKIMLGTWTSTDGFNSTVTFTENEYTISMPESEYITEETHTYSYKILSVDFENNQYKISVERTDTKGNADPMDIRILQKDEQYEISSNTFEFSRSFIKEAKETSFAPEISEQSEQASNNTTTTVVSSIRKPIDEKDSAFISKINKDVDKEIIGMWQGITGDYTDEDRIIYLYEFDEDGAYAFSKVIPKEATIEGFPYNETGTYTITHEQTTTELYHSSLIMNHGSETTIKRFYLSGRNPIKLIMEDDTEPTYSKQ